MPNYSKLPGQRGEVYSFEGYCYYKDKVSLDGNSTYLKCKDSLPCNGGTCSGRAVLKMQTDLIRQTKGHSHPASTHQDEAAIRNFKEALKTAAEECSTGLLRECYDQVATNHESAAVLVPFSAVEKSMAIWRRQQFPKNPDSATAVHETFARFAGQINHKFALYFKTGGTTPDGSFLILLNSDDRIKRALKNTPSIQVDGTFRSAPKTFYQVVHFFLESNDVVFCFASVWLTGKSEELYNYAFHALKALLPRDCKPTLLMSDYEKGLQNALQGMFPDAHLSGCVFHFCQSVYKNLMKIGLCKTYKANRKFQSWVHMIFCLPLLPIDKIAEAWMFLKTTQFSTPEIEKRLVERFTQYMDHQWVSEIGPACLSVFGCDRRTNNDSEVFNRYLNRRAKVRHPNVFTFGEIVTECLQKTAVELESLERGIPVRRSKKNTIQEKNVKIRILQEKVASRRMEPVAFLTKAYVAYVEATMPGLLETSITTSGTQRRSLKTTMMQ